MREELAATRRQLAEAQELIRAIRLRVGDFDLVNGPKADRITEQLRISEEKFAKAFETSPAAIVISRLSDGAILDLNKACADLIGNSREELIGQHSNRFWPSNDDRAHWAQQILEQGSYFNCEQVMLRDSGEPRVMLASASKMNVAGEELVLSTWLDITERKLAEEAMRASESKAEARAQELATIMNTIPVAAYIAHDPDCRLITGNRAAHEMLRVSLGSGLSITAPENENRKYRFIRDGRELSLDELPMRIAATGQEVRNAEFTLAFEDGSRSDFLGNAAPLFDESGQLRGVVGGFLDITERKKAETALREREEQFTSLVENLTSAVALIDETGQFVVVNKAFRRLFAIKEAEILNVNSLDLSRWEFFDELGKLLQIDEHPVRKAGRTCQAVRDRLVRMVLPDGKDAKWLLVSAEPILNANGTLKERICVFHDMTKLKRAEQALMESERIAFHREQLRALAERLQTAREEERTRVARDLHDDLGQLLTAVKMDLVWIEKRLNKQEPEIRKQLRDAISLIEDGASSVRRICSGLRPSVLDDLGIGAAIEWQADEFSSRTGIPCRLSLTTAPLLLTRNQATAFFRIFQECLTNVSRHARAKTVDVSLKQEEHDLVMVVRDDGSGFRHRVGTCSLGILGMKERAQMCGGDLTIASSPGKGTTVTLRVSIRQQLNGASHAHPDC